MRIFGAILVIGLCFTSGCGPTADEVVAAQQRLEQSRVEAQRLQYKAAVERVLQLDDRTSAIRDLPQRVSAMKNIDTSECPPEFRSAYLDHTDAWLELARARQARSELASDGSIESTLIRSLFASANGSSETPVEDLLRSDAGLAQMESNASQRISSTFAVVQKIAFQYGAALPKH
ncbi:hypothetical protein [Terriglobus roseus]|uniref:Lipoprotein n=1 Tax=Terriglobus roseus TaxID=392734 RepID=A0A1H4NRJ5_9BACT|nr:hypothetical protein [Terriglobus roseus]SEB97749.1 hypothetical protein SAMN05443244_2331 [Terriglobus roseus]